VRGDLHAVQVADEAPENAHGREALSVPRLRSQVLLEPLAQQTPEDTRTQTDVCGHVERQTEF